MKIFYLITKAEAGGAQVHVLDVIRGLHSGCRAVLGVGEDGFLADAARRLGVRVHILKNLVQPTNPVKDARCLADLVELLRREQPDLLHAHTSKAGIVGRLAATIAGIPSVFTAHSWAFSEGTSWKWKAVGVPLEYAAAHCCSRIINVSEANRRLARRYGVPAGKMVTVHNGIPDEGPTARPDSPGECRIIMVARFAPQKDQLSLVRVLRGLHSPARVIFVGDGPTLPAVRAEAERFGVDRKIDFLGERHDVAELLASSHVFALATHYEGFPISILEAMRSGLPVVATAVGGVGEAVADGVSGYLVPHGDLAALQHRLSRLAADPSLRARQGAESRRIFLESFQLPGMVNQTLAVYRAASRNASSASLSPERGLVK